ncbi:MAG: T9SS type A sorting domain-containing protein [Ignavibacteriaceae bacterium]|nr:T9SS type A sorting domain-containing protein [Ignavibacteriaceae bacterium]
MFNYLHAWNGSIYTSLNYPNDRSEGVVEDSQNRLWSLGEYYNLKYYNDATNSWTSVPFDGWGYKIAKDPTRPGTIWASSGFQALRTDGSYNFTRYNTDFPELDPQSDLLTTVAADLNGIAWVGSNKGLFKLNAETGTYQFYSPSNSQIPGDNISPLLVTPDGKLWFANFQSTTTSTYGLCWFDGTNFGIFPQQQTGGLPHAQIYDIEVKNIQNGYELWISCASRGVAVLTVETSVTNQDEIKNLPTDFILNQNYPNPFNPTTKLSFVIGHSSFVTLKVYDILGNKVATLLNEVKQPGTYEVDFNAADLSSGTYFYKLQAGSFIETKKMILLR